MKSIVRSILAIVVGVVIAPLTIMAVHQLSYLMYPLPAGFDPNNQEAWEALIRTLPLGALVLVVVAWESGAVVGGALAAWIAGRAYCWHAAIIGCWVLVGTIMNFLMLKFNHPTWMVVAGFGLPIPLSLLAGKLVAIRTPAPMMSHP